jgi:hypothetical protein
MRFWIYYLLTVFSIIALILSICISISVRNILSDENFDYYDKIITLDSGNQLFEFFAVKGLMNVPKEHLNKLIQYGYDIHILNHKDYEYIHDQYNTILTAKQSVGLHVGSEKKIYLKSTIGISSTVIHEIGHALDTYDKITTRDEFITLYEDDKHKVYKSMFTPDAYCNIKEYFANRYQERYTHTLSFLYLRLRYPDSMIYL